MMVALLERFDVPYRIREHHLIVDGVEVRALPSGWRIYDPDMDGEVWDFQWRSLWLEVQELIKSGEPVPELVRKVYDLYMGWHRSQESK